MNEPLRTLFVCAGNKRRSVTAEQMYRNDARLLVRSAGLRSDAPRRVSPADLKWADIVFVMERAHRSTLRQRFADLDLPEIHVLDIPDEYDFMDPQLQENLRLTLDPELAVWVAAKQAALEPESGNPATPHEEDGSEQSRK